MLSSSGQDLSLIGGVPSGATPLKLRSGSVFSQVDLLAGHLKYRLTATSTKTSLDDTFSFRVMTNKDQVDY